MERFMKRFICILSIALCGVLFVGCGVSARSQVDFNNHLIEVRNNLFVGQDETFYATVCTGEREQEYALDGVVGELVPFGIVTIARLDNEMLKQEQYPFTLVVNGENITGSLEKSPYDNTYSADIEQVIADDAEVEIQLVIDGVNVSQSLANISSSFTIDKDRAIEIACSELKDSVSTLSKQKNNLSEAFVKILKDYSGEGNRYYWYIGIISPEGKTSGVLIDTASGDIVSKKV